MTISSKEDLAGMTLVGKLVGEAIQEMTAAARPGMTTAELDEVGAGFLRRHGARSAPQMTYNFPGFNLISVNEQIVHGVPGGYIADSATTVLLPPISLVGRKLRKCARAAFQRALAVARVGQQVNDIGRAVEGEVRRHGFSVLRNLCGHGVGKTIHEAPEVPNFYDPRSRTPLTDGLVLAVEPMISAEPAQLVTEPDGWTIRTDNRSLTAHYEHTIVIRRGEPLILTALSAA
jgi:methionyl aminopeptidase